VNGKKVGEWAERRNIAAYDEEGRNDEDEEVGICKAYSFSNTAQPNSYLESQKARKVALVT
jgi:hypothetical protein